MRKNLGGFHGIFLRCRVIRNKKDRRGGQGNRRGRDWGTIEFGFVGYQGDSVGEAFRFLQTVRPCYIKKFGNEAGGEPLPYESWGIDT